MFRLVRFSCCFGAALFLAPTLSAFELAGPGGAATILVPAGEPDYVRVAAEDLVSDVEKITGRRPVVVARLEDCRAQTVVLASVDQPASAALLNQITGRDVSALRSRWEAYQVATMEAKARPITQALVIAGSNPRGTMFGLYALIEQYLGVDPMHFWAERPPQRQERLAWPAVNLAAGEPTFRYRGWFINDEDLLTGWRTNQASRPIEYKFYQRIIHPEVMERICEAMVRLQYNLLIPSSFLDLANPAEAALVECAVRRGLFVSMHHQEPVGVTGLFTFPNYWKARGKEVPFSFGNHREQFAEVWRHYAQLWSRYGDQVIWQLGLRGKGDRPVWQTDSLAPVSAQDRGRLISDAIALQWDIIRSVDQRAMPAATTTLWMEGADLHAQGHLKFPEGVTVIFSDNSPGWGMQDDFFQIQRQPGMNYGIYYHQALWGSGPHFCQAVSPWKMREVFGLAVERGDTNYMIINASNVREYLLGLDASARLLRDFSAFQPDDFLRQWCRARFGTAAEAAERSYRAYFDSYVKTENQAEGKGKGARGGDDAHALFDRFIARAGQGSRFRLDGETLGMGKQLLGGLAGRVASGRQLSADTIQSHEQTLRDTQTQRQKLDQAGAMISEVMPRLEGQGKTLFENNLVAQQRLMRHMAGWLEQILEAEMALQQGRRDTVLARARRASEEVAAIRQAQALASRGQWQGWYAGDWLMDMRSVELQTQRFLRACEPKGGSE